MREWVPCLWAWRPWFAAPLLAATVASCGTPDAGSTTAGLGSQDASADARADSGSDSGARDAGSDADARAPDGGSSDAGADGRAQDSGFADTGSGATADGGAFSCSFDAGSAPDGSPVCGDGWRDPGTEECDDGLRDASTRRACSAACQVLDELVVAPAAADAGVLNGQRTLGIGRHPIAASTSTLAVTYLEPNAFPLSLSLASFSAKGVAGSVAHGIQGPSSLLPTSNPVVAALPCDQYAVAWTDYGGDGDELGVALNLVTPGAVPATPPVFANATTLGSQFDPDIVWTGSQLVVAWVDTSNPATQPDVIVRTLDATLTPSNEQPLGATGDAEADVVLAAFGGSWAAAWRDDANGLETIRVHTGSTDWTVGPAFLPAPSGNKPALAQLDATHLLVAYTVGLAPSTGGADAGAADGGAKDAAADSGGGDAGPGVVTRSKIQVAVLNMAAPGTVSGVDVVAKVTTATSLSQAQPNVASVNGSPFLGWWTEGVLGDPNGEELWLKSLSWSGTSLTTSAVELSLPRWPQARVGDQRGPAMAASTLPPGGALLLGWDDFGRGIATGEDNSDVVMEVVPIPALQKAGDGGP